MSAIELADVKKALRVIHTSDDELLERLIASAVREFLAFINHESLPALIDTEDLTTTTSSSSTTTEDEAFIPEDCFQGIVWIVQGQYEGDIEQQAKYRAAAETLWQPYRQHMGV